MSYCRWSTDDFQCDLYCYADVGGGFTTHVAARRRVLPDNMPPRIPCIPGMINDYLKRDRVVMKIIQKAPLVPIGLPHDGAYFNDPDLPSFLARLIQLKEAGYRFPGAVIEAVKAEIEAEENL